MTKQDFAPFELGKKYKDKLHGYEGVAVSHCRYVSGCDRVLLENVKDDETKGIWFDINMLEDVNLPDDKSSIGFKKSITKDEMMKEFDRVIDELKGPQS